MKNKLKQLIGEIKNGYTELNKVINTTNNNKDFTDEAKTRVIEGAKRKFEELANGRLTVLNRLIDQKILGEKQSMQQRYESKKDTLEYQVGLSNTLKILELTAATMTPKAVMKAIQPYICDDTAVAAFTSILNNASQDNSKLLSIDIDSCISESTRTLSAFKKSFNSTLGVIAAFNYESLPDGNFAYSPEVFEIGLSDTLDYVENKFDNNLNAI